MNFLQNIMNNLKFLTKNMLNAKNIMHQFIIYTLQLTDHSVSTKEQNIQSQISGTEKNNVLLYDQNYLSRSRIYFKFILISTSM